MKIVRARFNQISRDLFWEVFDGEKYIRWSGYDDNFWWNNVANTEQFQVRGKYKLNPKTDEVEIL